MGHTMHLTFDTLAFANKLKAAGFEPKLAEAQAEAQAEVFADLLDNSLATKEDIRELRSELRAEIKDLRTEFHADIQALRMELLHKLGGLMVAGITVLAALITLMPHH